MAYLDPKSHFAIADRLRSWFVNGASDDASAVEIRPSWQQQVYADIGSFLAENSLDPTPDNYDLAYQFRAASDARLVSAVREEIAQNGALGPDAAERIFAQSGGPVSADMLAGLAERIEAEASGLTRIASQSAGEVSEFSSALERECATGGEAVSIMQLTQTMVARTRLAEAQLRHAHGQLSGLRTDLIAAQRAADVDPLTELPNRRAFKRELEALITAARKAGTPLSLGFCDIDLFKKFNDLHGHETGDRVLRYVAAALARAFRDTGIVGRFGGEEFVVALPEMSLAQARNAIDTARQKLSVRKLRAAVDNTDLGSVTFSAGVASLSDSDSSADLLRRADEALYRAKGAGRNRVVIG